MKAKNIHFFSPKENVEIKPNVKDRPVKEVPLTGYLSKAGKVVLPAKTIEKLGLDTTNTRFRIGRPAAKRKSQSLYLIPTSADTTDAFTLSKAGRGFAIPLAGILRTNNIEFGAAKVGFTLKPFAYETGEGYEVIFGEPAGEITGKRRGRKPKN